MSLQESIQKKGEALFFVTCLISKAAFAPDAFQDSTVASGMIPRTELVSPKELPTTTFFLADLKINSSLRNHLENYFKTWYSCGYFVFAGEAPEVVHILYTSKTTCENVVLCQFSSLGSVQEVQPSLRSRGWGVRTRGSLGFVTALLSAGA